jgi:gliding motility-associated protein GldM
MGVKNCPESPRQKMINMMYIVLTAMLALNVAAEVLEAYRVVDSSLIQTLTAVDNKNSLTYASFEQAYAENPAKVQEWKTKADLVRSRTDSVVNYISTLKERLVRASGTKTFTSGDQLKGNEFTYVTLSNDTLIIKKEDDLNSPSEIMIAQKGATQLKDELSAYKDFLISMLTEDDKHLIESIEQELETADSRFTVRGGDRRSWEVLYFENKPLAAILTLLSKFQIDVKNSEANLINYLYAQIDAGSFMFNKLDAQVIANSAIILQGEEYIAEVFLAAIDTTVDPIITVNNRALPIIDGKGIYRLRANETGTFRWSGVLNYRTPDGLVRNYPFTREYQVTAPSVTISPTKMNVFYRGIPNPIDVSVPGIAKENLDIRITNGRIGQVGNVTMVYPNELDEQGRRTTVSVYARVGGAERLMGSTNFRVKRVPDPIAQIGNQSGGNIRKEDLEVEDGILAVLPDFDFDLRFTVTQFDINITAAGGFVNTFRAANNRFTPDQKAQFRNLAIGSIIYIDNIKARGDDGTDRDLDPISFKIR